MKILGIETSCDETSATVAEHRNGKIKILSNIVFSQIKIHKKYGGVVPEVAAREHVLNILPVIDECLKKAGIKKSEAPKKIDCIAVTIGPGLITSLIAGIETAKTLSYVWGVPIVGVNHIEGHIRANFIGNYKKIKFPALVLTVSGGHTLLALMKTTKKIKTIGETRDDAAGEAFDKSAKLLGIGYPGGPIIAEYAAKAKKTTIQKLPRPMLNSTDFDFSFSGLKTALRYALQKDKDWKNKIPEYCAELQQAVIDVLIHKTINASKKYQVKTIMLSGGVSANRDLRAQLSTAVKKLNLNFIMPNMAYTTDNAAMIAAAGCFKIRKGEKFFTPTDWRKLKVDCCLALN